MGMIKIKDIEKNFVEYLEINAENTVDAYTNQLRNMIKYLQEKGKIADINGEKYILISDIGQLDFIDYLSSREPSSAGVASASFGKLVECLEQLLIEPEYEGDEEFIKFIQNMRAVNRNRNGYIQGRRENKLRPPSGIEKSSIRDILYSIPKTYKEHKDITMTILMACAGMSPQELANLQMKNIVYIVDSDAETTMHVEVIRDTKKKKEKRVVTLSNKVNELMDAYLQAREEIIQKKGFSSSETAVFINLNGTPLSRNGILSNIQGVLSDFGLEGKEPSDLRQFTREQLIKNGLSAKRIAEILGTSPEHEKSYIDRDNKKESSVIDFD